MVASGRHNNVFDVPMLEEYAKASVAEALRPETDIGTRWQLREHTDQKRRADHMVATAHEGDTKRKMDGKRTQKAQKEAERPAERIVGRGAPASGQSTRFWKQNAKIVGTELQ